METIRTDYLVQFDPQHRDQIEALVRLLPVKNVHAVEGQVIFTTPPTKGIRCDPYFILKSKITRAAAQDVVRSLQAAIEAKDETDLLERLRSITEEQ